MDHVLKEKIERHKRELERSELHPETKERLSAFVDKIALASNGCEDKMAALTDLVADLCLMKVEDRVRAPSERRKLIDEEVRKYDAAHDEKCPVRGMLNGRLGWLYAFRWQLTICIVAMTAFPNGPAILQAVRDLWK